MNRSIVLQPRTSLADRPGPSAIRDAALAFHPRVIVHDSAGAGGSDGARLLVDLLARTFSSLGIDTPNSQLRTELAAIATGVNPAIEISDRQRTHAFAWGETTAADREVHWCGGDRWTAVVDRSGPAGAPSRLPALVAAALAYGEAFKAAFGAILPSQWTPSGRIHLSLLDYTTGTKHADGPSWPANVDVGTLYAVGIGAIGMAFGYGLRSQPCRGKLIAIDNQRIDESNLQRYLLTTPQAIGEPKADWLRRSIQRPGLSVKPMVDTWERFLSEWRRPWRFETIVAGVDSAGVRRRIAAALPRLVFNGGVGASVVTLGRYEFNGVRECLHCAYLHVPPPRLFEVMSQQFGIPNVRIQQLEDANLGFTPEDIALIQRLRGLSDDLARTLLGKVPRSAYAMLCGFVSPRSAPDLEGGIVPVAHVPVLAGLLLANEVVKASVVELQPWRLDHVFELDLKDDLNERSRLTAVQQIDAPGCICTDPDYRAAFDEKWRRLPSR